eukprot:6363665-Amphidinium_carterae.1
MHCTGLFALHEQANPFLHVDVEVHYDVELVVVSLEWKSLLPLRQVDVVTRSLGQESLDTEVVSNLSVEHDEVCCTVLCGFLSYELEDHVLWLYPLRLQQLAYNHVLPLMMIAATGDCW